LDSGEHERLTAAELAWRNTRISDAHRIGLYRGYDMGAPPRAFEITVDHPDPGGPRNVSMAAA
jgi:hypothetical protein